MKTINEIADAVYENAIQHGFHNEPVEVWWPKMLLNSIGEITEVWDADRAGQLQKLCDKAEKMVQLGLRPLTNLEEEYADRIIRALDESRRIGINIQEAIEIKHAYNKTRPFKHGKTC